MTQEQPRAGLDFGDAIRALKAGRRVSRAGWNGKDMWLILAASSIAAVREHGHDKHNRLLTLPHIVMKTAQAQYVPWLASQTDMLADDWTDPDAPEQGAPAAKRYTRADIDDLKWATGVDIASFDQVNVWARMKDGQEFRTSFVPQRGELLNVAAVGAALSVANGEAP